MIINKFNIPIYGIMIVLSLIIGIVYITINLKKEKIKKEYIIYYDMLYIVFTLFGGIAISRIITLSNSLSSYAAAISCVACALIYNKIVPNKNIYLKYTILSLPLVYAISKIGCFLSGCCYGIPYNGILSVTYTNGLSTPLFPIQLLETIVFLIIFIVVNIFKKNKSIIEITLLLCAISKLLLDYLRYDHINKIISLNQVFSLIVIIVAVILLIKKNLKK